MAGKLHEWQVAAETPAPEPPPTTGLHPVPTSPVFGPRLNGRDAGILSASGVMVEGTEPGPLPIVVPPLPADAPRADAARPTDKTSTGTEHLNRLQNSFVRRASYSTVLPPTAKTQRASELRFVR